jgi:hypothetical protein
VTPLDAALPLPDRDAAAEPVGRDLDFDVARPLEQLLGVDCAVAEGRLGLGAGALERGGGVLVAVDPAHSLAAAPRRSLEQDRVTRAPAELPDLRVVARGPGHAGHDRNARLLHQDAARRLRAHGFDGLGRGSDERQTRARARPREPCALREKSVSRVHERRRGPPRRFEQCRHREVALRGGRGAEPDRVVRGRDVRCRAVGVGVDRDGLDPEVAAGAENAEGDFAAVRDEESHGREVEGGRR